MIKNRNIWETALISVTIGVLIFAYSLYFIKDPDIRRYVQFLSFLVAAVPIFIVQYMRYSEISDIQKNFPIFLRDIAENVKAGMTLVKAVKMLKSKNYGKMTRYVQRIASQLDWGVSFGDVLNAFAKEIEDPLITKTVKTLIETHKFGGKIEDVLTAVVNSVITVQNLKKEREAEIFAQMINGYVIYIIFVIIMFILVKYMIPMITESQSVKVDPEFIKSTLKSLLLIQSFFSGLIIGKMAEGTISAGFKHVVVMGSIGYLATLFM